jgi:DNA (cytosine-5)-methyltransferase 1
MDGYWLNEPDIPRTAKGVKNRVAWLCALGNCVVPMQAYPIFRAIAETERESEWNFGNCGR